MKEFTFDQHAFRIQEEEEQKQLRTYAMKFLDWKPFSQKEKELLATLVASHFGYDRWYLEEKCREEQELIYKAFGKDNTQSPEEFWQSLGIYCYSDILDDDWGFEKESFQQFTLESIKECENGNCEEVENPFTVSDKN